MTRRNGTYPKPIPFPERCVRAVMVVVDQIGALYDVAGFPFPHPMCGRWMVASLSAIARPEVFTLSPLVGGGSAYPLTAAKDRCDARSL